MCMNSKRSLIKLFLNIWHKAKCRGHPTNPWVAQVDTLKKELDLQDKVLDVKGCRKPLDKRQWEEFELALQCKSKLCFYRELKQDVGFEEYLEFVKVGHSRLFFKFHSGTYGLFKELSIVRVGYRNVLIVGLVRSQLNLFFLSVKCIFSREKFLLTT